MNWNGESLFQSALLGGGSGGSSGSGGSGGGSVKPKDVNFYDYDGTLVNAYTVAEANALSELPAGPLHDGLVFQGWNYSLDSVKATNRKMDVGAMYTTDDGTTRVYITLQEGRTSPRLGICVNGKVTVDWGDGTNPDVLTGTNSIAPQFTSNHAYAAPGDYVIQLTVDGEAQLMGDSTPDADAHVLRHSHAHDKRNRTYQNSIRRVEVGSGITGIGKYAFKNCGGLVNVVVPNSVTSVGDSAFQSCYSLKSVVVPDSVPSIGGYAFAYCYSLKSVVVPNSVTSVGDSAFQSCSNLENIFMPDSVLSIGGSAFAYCYSFSNVAIPAGVKSVGSNTFQNCFGVAVYDFVSCTTVPTLAAATAFTGIQDDCEIRVPAALYEEWIAATNWTTYADKIKAV